MGLASDGGLLVPESIPDVSARLAEWQGLSYPELASEVMAPFVGDIDEAVFKKLVLRSYKNFQHPEVAPVAQPSRGCAESLGFGSSSCFLTAERAQFKNVK